MARASDRWRPTSPETWSEVFPRDRSIPWLIALCFAAAGLIGAVVMAVSL